MESVLMRVSVKFKQWCDEMKKEKNENEHERGELLSDKKITELIPKHTHSTAIKEDIKNFRWRDKKGVTFNLFVGIAMALIGIVLIAVLGFVFSSVYAGLNQDVMVGQVNLSNVTQGTYGVFVDAYNSQMDILGLILIFGMIVGMLIASFLMRGKWDKILIVVDLIIMVVVYIFAVMISNYYEILVTASSGVITQFESLMPKSSNFLLHLPIYVVIIGVVSMVLFYASIPKRDAEKDIAYEGVNPNEF